MQNSGARILHLADNARSGGKHRCSFPNSLDSFVGPDQTKQDAPVANASGGFSFGSPTTIVSAPVNAPVAVLNDNDLKLKLANNTANVLGSLGTEIWQ